MAEYIKREDAIKRLRKAEDLYRKTMGSSVRADMIAHCVKLISEVTAADVVEVVRCKDCKHATMTYDGLCKYCEIISPEEKAYYAGDFYCAYGERRGKCAFREGRNDGSSGI